MTALQTETTTRKLAALLLKAAVIVGLVVGLSVLSVRIWGEKPETVAAVGEIVIAPEMTVAAFGEANGLERTALKEIFGLGAPADLQKAIGDFGLDRQAIVDKAKKTRALAEEHGTKNWVKIPIKFGLWAAFLAGVFVLLRHGRVTAKNRKWLYLGSAALFGVVLGADPSPMGTVKDAIVLYGAEGVIFPPRMVALGLFLLTVVLANKFICSWGCQVGVLQDFLFRLNRNPKDTKGRLRQVKLPFAVTNTIRIAVFVVFTAVAVVSSYDLIGAIDPFKIYKPLVLGGIGIGFLPVLLVASLFVYRPWCHLFCPFGLVGWVAEKASLFRIGVDYDKCKACTTCATVCPSDVMGAILKQDRTIPDCFACGTCVQACPSGAISFRFGKRAKPPAGKFDTPSETAGDSI